MPGAIEGERQAVEDPHLAELDVDRIDREPRPRPARCPRWRRDRRAAPRAAAPPALERREHADQPLRKQQHDDDEDDRDADLPELEAVAQRARQRADHDRAEHRPEQSAAAADRGPDDEVGREPEAAQLRRHQALLRRVERAADAGEQAADAERDRLEPIGVEAEHDDAALVVGERRPEHAERRAVEPAGAEDRADQRQRGDVVGGGVAVEPGQAGDALQAVEAAGHRLPVVGDLIGEQRERERDHREVRPALAAPAKDQQRRSRTRAGPRRRRRAESARAAATALSSNAISARPER